MVIIWPGAGPWRHHPVCKRPGRVRCAGTPLPMSPVPARTMGGCRSAWYRPRHYRPGTVRSRDSGVPDPGPA